MKTLFLMIAILTSVSAFAQYTPTEPARAGFDLCLDAFRRYDGRIGENRLAICRESSIAQARCMHDYIDMDGIINDTRISHCRRNSGYQSTIRYDKECLQVFREWDGNISDSRIEICRNSTPFTANCMREYIRMDNKLNSSRVLSCQR